MTDEEYVLANWESCVSRQIPGSHDEDMLHEILIGGINATRTWCKTEAEAWAAAAEFTRKRLEQIRQREEEMLVIGQAVRVFPFHVEPCSRILDRLESALADLKQGMRTAALGDD